MVPDLESLIKAFVDRTCPHEQEHANGDKAQEQRYADDGRDALISDPEEQERHNADDAQRYPYCDTSAFAGFSFLLVSMCFRILRKRFPTYPPHFPSNTHSFDLTII